MKRTIIENPIDLHRALWWAPAGDAIACELCPRACVIRNGERGFCSARINSDGVLYAESYGRITVSQLDSVEKKPLFHYMIGANLLSVGSYGCNLDCAFCQNHIIARSDEEVPYRELSPEQLVAEAVEKRVSGIAFTYNEPMIWAEYIICVSQYARKKGLKIILNTNGYIHGAARDDLIKAVDAMNIDIKGFSNDIYNELCDGTMRPVLETCEIANREGKHIELSYIMIPGKTDQPDMIGRFGGWVARMLGTETPVHLMRIHPDRMLQTSTVTTDALGAARMELMSSGLRFVYMGGTGNDFGRDTICPDCGRTWVERRAVTVEHQTVKGEKVSKHCPSYSDVKVLSRNGICPGCGRKTNIVENPVFENI
ncbi:MAG: AmmeMemoRadiSam system radical SAM enzyme [Euryarchaeota archaeon]|nr:AmmeMemoRadiSam system radical SAM enzyme [Euryarchaeota archaeon]